MRGRRLREQLLPSHILLAFCVLSSMAVFAFFVLRSVLLSQAVSGLEDQAALLKQRIEAAWAANRHDEVDALCKTMGAVTMARFTVVDRAGRVCGDSEATVDGMANHAGRVEIRDALAGRIGVAQRHSPTQKHQMLYVALPLHNQDGIVGVARAALPFRYVDLLLVAARRYLLLVGFLIGVLAFLFSVWAALRVSRPLEILEKGACRLADGDLAARLPIPLLEEPARVAQALNRMAGQLDEKIKTILNQKNERETILASMNEGVLAVDCAERILSVNPAAARLLALDAGRAPGRLLPEIVRNSDLQKLVVRALAEHAPVEAELALHVPEELCLRAAAALLRDARDTIVGVVVVLNDITRLKRLEIMRRDFVANVSHELRTPITAMMGFVETLREGSALKPGDADRFLEIMARQVARMDALVRDLLTLSRLEHQAERGEVMLADGGVRVVLEHAVQACLPQAEKKQVALRLNCPEDFVLAMNAPLLEQALINLMDNAVKFSPSGAVVSVNARASDDVILIEVKDAGPGIAPHHLSRLFERFYRVDSARSRQDGGTGLGLAIVRHIALAHHGSVSVASILGKGSVFTIHLPTPSKKTAPAI